MREKTPEDEDRITEGEGKTFCVLDIELSRVSVDTLHNLSLVSYLVSWSGPVRSR